MSARGSLEKRSLSGIGFNKKFWIVVIKKAAVLPVPV